MRLTRRIVTIAVTITCGLALAACGQQVVKHVTAGDSVHSALTSALNSPTTQFVVTAQGLAGQASIADGSVSVVVTTSRDQGASTSTSMADESIDVSIDYQTADLVDLRAVGGSEYVRVDLKYIESLAGPTAFAAESRTLDQLAARPGFGFLHDLLLGNWVGVPTSTLTALAHQLAPEVPGAVSSISGLQNASGLGLQVTNSWMQSLRTWLSIHQTSSDEYSLTLPLRGFAGSILQGLAKPLATYANEPFLSQSQLAKAIDKIPANLSLHANLWVAKGSMTKLQILIPDSTASLWIAVSHPAEPVQVPGNATMLTSSDLTEIFGSLSGPLAKALGSARTGSLSAL